MSTATAFSDVIVRDLSAGDRLRGAPTGLKWAAPEIDVNQATGVTLLDTRSQWYVNALKRLADFAVLEDDWDECGAEAPNSASIEITRGLLAVLSQHDFEPWSVDASAEGGVCISFRNRHRYGDVEVFNTGEIFAVTSEGGMNTTVWEVPDLEGGLGSAINRIRTFLRD